MKKYVVAIVAFVLMAGCSVTAFAGQWKQDAKGWWWDNGNGTYPKSAWQWCDGNGDGVAECYYFDGNGYCLLNTTTPDGYTVDGNGAWIENGVVKTQGAAALQTTLGTEANEAAVDEFLRNVQFTTSSNASVRYENKVIYLDVVIPDSRSTDSLLQFAVNMAISKSGDVIAMQQKLADEASKIAKRPVRSVFTIYTSDGVVMYQNEYSGQP